MSHDECLDLSDAACAVYETAKILQERRADGVFTTAEFQDLISRISDYKRGSILPSDYCYNLINKWTDSFRFPMLEWEERGRYRFLGLDYSYNGDVFWKGEKVGTWRDGSCTLFHDPRV